MWPKNDVKATCEFLKNSSIFLKFMNDYSIDNLKDLEIMIEIAKYFRNVAMPSGVVVKSTGQAIVQTCYATIQLIKTFINTIGIAPVETVRLQKHESWLHEVEHDLLKEKIR